MRDLSSSEHCKYFIHPPILVASVGLRLTKYKEPFFHELWRS